MDPLRYTFRVACSPAEAFRLWTAAASVWWPMATHSVGGQRDAELVLEPRVGGRIFERLTDGREFDWGSVVAFEPPRRLVCDWLVADLATQLEVRFLEEQDGGTQTRVAGRGCYRATSRRATGSQGHRARSTLDSP
jgi:uncharacterized protein YndB with AHSA1/START domain